MKSLKTPLRYPGGKSRACTKMDQYFPDLRNYNEYREPFLGGGSVALHVTKKYPDIKVWVNDLYKPLVNFWIQLRDNSREIKRQLQELKQRHPDPTSARVLLRMLNDISPLNPENVMLRLVLSVSMLLTSALFLVSLSPHLSQNKQATPTSLLEGSKSCPSMLN